MGTGERLTAKQFQDSDGAEDWRVLARGASAWFDAPSQAAGADLVRRVAQLSIDERLPDVDLRGSGVHVRIRTAVAGLTSSDVAMARMISAAARDLGLTADPSAVQTMQIGIDTLDKRSVMPFWQAVLGYEKSAGDLVDPMRRHPMIWFQQQDQPRPLRNRIHLDVARPTAHEAVGGRPTYTGQHHTTLADAEGNETDVIAASTLGDNAPQTADWRVLFGAMTFYRTASPQQATELADVVADLADDAGLPLLVDLRPDGLTIDTGKDQWENERFAGLPRRIQAAARSMALAADPTRLRFVQIGIDAVDIPRVRDFWRAALGYEYDPRPRVTDIYDPRQLNVPIFFQQMPASEEDRRRQRNRFHLDVFVPHDQARARIDAALAAGGRIAYDEEAPEWWTLADPEGNEVDIAVSVGREELWQAAQSGTG